eukprot:jgi/Mesen1/43/ME1094207C05660
MAPEVLRRKYGPQADVWSAGVMLYILLCGVPPFWAETEQGVAQAVLKGEVDYTRDPWPAISAGAKELVAAMLNSDPAKRLSAEQVLGEEEGEEYEELLEAEDQGLSDCRVLWGKGRRGEGRGVGCSEFRSLLLSPRGVCHVAPLEERN